MPTLQYFVTSHLCLRITLIIDEAKIAKWILLEVSFMVYFIATVTTDVQIFVFFTSSAKMVGSDPAREALGLPISVTIFDGANESIVHVVLDVDCFQSLPWAIRVLSRCFFHSPHFEFKFCFAVVAAANIHQV